MTSQESLDLISRMLRNTHDRFERGAGKPFVIFGYITLVVSLIVWYALKTTGNDNWNWLWFIIPLIGGFYVYFLLKEKPQKVVTYIDRAVSYVWYILGGCAVLISLYVALFDKPYHTVQVISMLMFAGEAIIGSIIKLRYVQIMGLIGIVLSFGLLFLSGLDQIIGFAGMSLLAMIIPGHIMNAQAKKAVGSDL